MKINKYVWELPIEKAEKLLKKDETLTYEFESDLSIIELRCSIVNREMFTSNKSQEGYVFIYANVGTVLPSWCYES